MFVFFVKTLLAIFIFVGLVVFLGAVGAVLGEDEMVVRE